MSVCILIMAQGFLGTCCTFMNSNLNCAVMSFNWWFQKCTALESPEVQFKQTFVIFPYSVVY